MDVIKYPWRHYSYEDLKKYIKFEFAFRHRNVDEDGKYTGYTHEKKYGARDCREDDFPEHFKDFDGSEITKKLICPDFDLEAKMHIHLKNNK